MSEDLFARAREQRELWQRTILESRRLRAANRELLAHAQWLRDCLRQKDVPLVHLLPPVPGEAGLDDQADTRLHDW